MAGTLPQISVKHNKLSNFNIFSEGTKKTKEHKRKSRSLINDEDIKIKIKDNIDNKRKSKELEKPKITKIYKKFTPGLVTRR